MVPMHEQTAVQLSAALPTTATAGASTPRIGRALSGPTTMILLVYLGIIVILMVVRQIKPTPDLFVIFASAVAVMLGRGRAFVRDWIPFLVIIMAWEAMRGLADDFGAEVQSDSIIGIERAFSFGVVPSESLQQVLYTPGSPTVLDLGMSLVYLGHFLVPLLVAFGLWVADRPRFNRYVQVLVLLSFAAFFTAIFLPVAPPRFAGDYGQALAVHDVVKETLGTLQLAPVTTWVYGNAIGNPVAAFPSLHAAYPLVAVFVLWVAHRRWAIALLAYTAVVWFAIVYTGHHYVIDAIGGAAYAGAVWLLVTARLPRRVGAQVWASARARIRPRVAAQPAP